MIISSQRVSNIVELPDEKLIECYEENRSFLIGLERGNIKYDGEGQYTIKDEIRSGIIAIEEEIRKRGLKLPKIPKWYDGILEWFGLLAKK